MPIATAPAPVAVREEQSVAGELIAEMARIRRAGRRHSRRPPELSALTGAQLELVRVVRRRPGISVADAAAELSLAANTVSTLVRRLSETGLLRRTPDDSDRRVARLRLASEISDEVEAWRDRRTLALGDAIAALPARDRRRLADAVAVLARLADHLESAGES